MKSELARPATGFISFTTPASAATCRAVGRTADGSRPASTGGIAALPLVAAPAAAPVTATPARNLRRLTSGCDFFRAILNLPQSSFEPAEVVGPADSIYRRYSTFAPSRCEGRHSPTFAMRP